jgi:hypothetical protein
MNFKVKSPLSFSRRGAGGEVRARALAQRGEMINEGKLFRNVHHFFHCFYHTVNVW